MTLKDLERKLDKFIDNEFCHLRKRVDKIFYILIGGLLSLVIGLLVLICRDF